MLLRLVKYDPDQPRAPAGSPQGGQWVAGAVSTLGKAIEESVAANGKVEDRHGAGDLVARITQEHRDALTKIIDTLPPEKRPTVLLHKGDEAKGIPTVWLLGWDFDEATDIHDHAQSEVGVSVVRGAVFEKVFGWDREADFDDKVKTEGVTAMAHERELRAGSVATITAPYIHEMGGITEGKTKDVTLHAYFPPLKKMGYYTFTDGKLKWDGEWDEGRPPSETDKARKCGHDHGGTDMLHLKIASEEQRIVWGEVYIPNLPDSDGEYMDEVTVREMAYQFMRDKKLASIDVEHDNKLVPGVGVVESFIARKNDPDFIPGSWVVGVHIPDDATWNKVKKGEINGFSIEALVRRVPVDVEIDIPPVVTGMTKSEKGIDHDHKYYVSYDTEGNFLGGRTDKAEDGHFHEIRRGTATEESNGHKHKFAHLDVMVEAGAKLAQVA